MSCRGFQFTASRRFDKVCFKLRLRYRFNAQRVPYRVDVGEGSIDRVGDPLFNAGVGCLAAEGGVVGLPVLVDGDRVLEFFG